MTLVAAWGATERQYEVYVLEVETGRVIDEYSAGNSTEDSQGYVAPDSPRAEGLTQMRHFAESTCREMAQEYGAAYAGEDEDTTQGIRDLFRAFDEGRL